MEELLENVISAGNLVKYYPKLDIDESTCYKLGYKLDEGIYNSQINDFDKIITSIGNKNTFIEYLDFTKPNKFINV